MGKIIVIDDNVDMRNILKDALEDEGHEVHAADNGESGLALVAQHTPQVVITDIFMPVKEGVNVVRTIKSKYPGIKILVISGADRRDNYFETAKKFGADETLAKPFMIGDLIDMVKKYM